MDTDDGNRHQRLRGPWLLSRSNWIWLGFLSVAGFFLVTEHRAHLLGFLPFLLVLACPLMHLFHHRGHGPHAPEDSRPGQREDPVQGERQ